MISLKQCLGNFGGVTCMEDIAPQQTSGTELIKPSGSGRRNNPNDEEMPFMQNIINVKMEKRQKFHIDPTIEDLETSNLQIFHGLLQKFTSSRKDIMVWIEAYDKSMDKLQGGTTQVTPGASRRNKKENLNDQDTKKNSVSQWIHSNKSSSMAK